MERMWSFMHREDFPGGSLFFGTHGSTIKVHPGYGTGAGLSFVFSPIHEGARSVPLPRDEIRRLYTLLGAYLENPSDPGPACA